MALAWVLDRIWDLREAPGRGHVQRDTRLAFLRDEVKHLADSPDDYLLSLFRGSMGASNPSRRDGYGVMALLGAFGGLRFGEVAALRRSDFDFDRSEISVSRTLTEVSGRIEFGPPKTAGSRRVVTLPDEIRHALGLHSEHQETRIEELRERSPSEKVSPTVHDTDPLLFTTSRGSPISRTRFRNRVWERAVSFLELKPRPTFHDLRHSHAAWLIAAKIPDKWIQVRMGHSSIRTTLDVYGHPTGDFDRQAAEALS